MAIELLRLVVGPHWCKGTDNGPDQCVSLEWCVSHLADPRCTSRRLLWCLLTSCADNEKHRRKAIKENQSRSIHGNMRSYWECQEVRENHPDETCTRFWDWQTILRTHLHVLSCIWQIREGTKFSLSPTQARADWISVCLLFSPLSCLFTNYLRIFWEELMFTVLFRLSIQGVKASRLDSNWLVKTSLQ